MEWAFAYGQRAKRHVLDGSEYPYSAWYRQRVCDVQAAQDIPLRPGCSVKLIPLSIQLSHSALDEIAYSVGLSSSAIYSAGEEV